MVLRKILSLFLAIFSFIRAILNRMICSVRRMKRNSGNLLPMTTDQVLSQKGVHHSIPSNEPVELESWDAWGQENEQPMSNGADPVASSIATFYASRKHVQEESAPVPETDYFSEMKPSLRKAPKIKILKKDDTSVPATSTRLKVDSSLLPMATDDLGELSTWDDGDNAWAAEAEEDLSWQAESTLRETRRQERENRTAQQKRKRQEKEDSRIENCDNNSRLIVDEDDNGKFRLERILVE